jgi:hypothetical protein
MATRWGTSHFVSYEKATNYYSSPCYGYSNTHEAVDRKLREGEIHIGPPTAKAGQKITLEPKEGRYWIEDEPNANARTARTSPTRSGVTAGRKYQPFTSPTA